MRLIDPIALKESIAFSAIMRDGKSLEKIIDEQPTITSEPHWIPVTERLPEVKQKVLVQYPDGSMATKRCNDAGHLTWFYSNAVAWMPAPKSYKEIKDAE